MKKLTILPRVMSTVKKNMKAIVLHKFGNEENLEVRDVPVPIPGENEVLIRVKSCGINPVDTYIRAGKYAKLPTLPAVLGREVAGLVEEIGPGVNDFQKGCRVFACLPDNGGYSEYVLSKKNNVFLLPETLTFNQGAALYVGYFTAIRALAVKCCLKAGEHVLVHGASGAVGIAAVQVAKAKGAFVVGTAGSADGMKLVKEVGADVAVNHKEKEHLNHAQTAIGGRGFDVIFENLSDVNLGSDLTVINKNSRIAVVGCRGTVEINPRLLMIKESSIIGIMLTETNDMEHAEMANILQEGIKEGWVNPIIGREYSLEEAKQAHCDIIFNKGAKGKLVFKID